MKVLACPGCSGAQYNFKPSIILCIATEAGVVRLGGNFCCRFVQVFIHILIIRVILIAIILHHLTSRLIAIVNVIYPQHMILDGRHVSNVQRESAGVELSAAHGNKGHGQANFYP